MSEYQYYEFRKIDSSLSDDAMQKISDLSSRAQVSRTSASFTYHYGDFRGDPIKVLTEHFDALFYTANWGSRRLAFRFPISVVNYDVFCRFAFGETIAIKRKEKHLIVDLFFEDDCLRDWVDGEGTLIASSDCTMICSPKTIGRYSSRGCRPRYWKMGGSPMPPFRRYLRACGNFRRGIGR